MSASLSLFLTLRKETEKDYLRKLRKKKSEPDKASLRSWRRRCDCGQLACVCALARQPTKGPLTQDQSTLRKDTAARALGTSGSDLRLSGEHFYYPLLAAMLAVNVCSVPAHGFLPSTPPTVLHPRVHSNRKLSWDPTPGPWVWEGSAEVASLPHSPSPALFPHAVLLGGRGVSWGRI